MPNEGQDFHERPEHFGEALRYTAAQSGFSERLIEKDYYCTLLLRQLVPLFEFGLVFKGGTALAKVHANFYRLSEDLDFAIPLPSDSRRSGRRAAIRPVKDHLARLPKSAPWLVAASERTGANENTQYSAVLWYTSCISGEGESIKTEISLCEPLVELPQRAPAATVLRDPLTRSAAVNHVMVQVISLQEAYAEKIRAALSRREPAIRDFYDLFHAIEAGIIGPNDGRLVELARAKLAVPGNSPAGLSPRRLETLNRQVAAQLRPVLRDQDFRRFRLDRVVDMLRALELGG